MAGKPLKMKLAVEFPLRRSGKHNPSPERTRCPSVQVREVEGVVFPGCLLTQALCDGVSKRAVGGPSLEDPGASDNVGVKEGTGG